MKKNYSVVLLAMFFLVFSPEAFAENKPFNGNPYYLKGNLQVIQEMTGRIDGDEHEDTVRLVVLYDETNMHAQRVWFEVQQGYPLQSLDRRKPKPFLVPLPEELQGYNLEAQLKNFIPGNQEQVFMTFDAAPNGPRCFVVIQIRADDVRKDARFLFDSRTMNKAILSGSFIGGYRAVLRVEDTRTTAYLDLSRKKEFYEKKGVYGAKGRILRPVAISAKKYDAISLGERDASGVCQLKAVIELFGVDDEDHIAAVECVLKYDPVFASWKVVSSTIHPAPGILFAQERVK